MKRLGAVVGLLVVALVGSLLVRVAIVESEEPLVVVHWSNSHPLREDLLLNMADQFNDEHHETPSGQPIEIRIVRCDSAVQAEDLVGRVTGDFGDHECEVDGERAGDPVIVTPQSDDWLVDINYAAGRNVVDREQARGAAIAKAYLGIVTYEGVAECLREARGEVGYADIVELAKNGWDKFIAEGSSDVSRGCPLVSWGEPLLSFTNPGTSTSGRNVLVTLYSMYADEPPSELDEADIEAAELDVREFQTLVDHYMPTTEALNRKIAESIGEGRFFLMPEDNVVSLAEGNETVSGPDGEEQRVKVTDLEMIYPTEGSVLNSNPAAIVEADWVSDDQLDAANRWIDYLREDEQQRAFMAAGFRPGTDLKVDAAQFERWGLDPQPPKTEIDPGRLKPKALKAIVDSWGEVKKPSVVTFVVDMSGSMERNEADEQVQKGLLDIVDEMQLTGADTSQIGLVTFNDDVRTTIPPAPLADVRKEIVPAITSMEDPIGDTALYDAVALGIQLTDEAAAPADATRAVVVLSDGVANKGERCLSDIVEMASEDALEGNVLYCAKDVDKYAELAEARDEDGSEIDPSDVVGIGLNPELNVQHDDLKVFFLGFGDADINIGRILAGATGADFQESPDDGIAEVVLELSGYF